MKIKFTMRYLSEHQPNLRPDNFAEFIEYLFDHYPFTSSKILNASDINNPKGPLYKIEATVTLQTLQSSLCLLADNNIDLARFNHIINNYKASDDDLNESDLADALNQVLDLHTFNIELIG
jgi:hypothetical protein